MGTFLQDPAHAVHHARDSGLSGARGDTCVSHGDDETYRTGVTLTATAAPNWHFVQESFASPLVVRVTDSEDAPLESITVTFSAPGSASRSGSDASATLSAPSAVTDANGLASVTATANRIKGDYVVQARVSTVREPITFALTNSPLNATITLTASPATSSPTDEVTLQATLVGDGSALPTGTVDFMVDGDVVCQGVPVDAQGMAQCSAGPLGAASYQLSAIYPGDDSHASAVSAPQLLAVRSNAPVPVPVNAPWALALLTGLVGLSGRRLAARR